ncbi:hypothetical protein GQ457_10G005060 [Hibiscus cannabinus]
MALGKKWRGNKNAVRFWSSTKGEARERVGVASRQQQKFTHTAGSKSFARVAEEHEVTSGGNVGRIKLFDIIHTKKDGSPITPEAAEIMDKLRDKRAEYEATGSSHGSINDQELENQVIAEVLSLERYGRVRFQGSFVSPTKYFGSSSSQYMPSQSNSSQLEVKRLKQEMGEKIAQLQAEAATREALYKAREDAHEEKYQDLQNQLQAIKKMLQDNPS